MDNIIRDIEDLIHDLKSMEGNVKADRVDTTRVLSNGDEQEIWKNTAKTYENGLLDAQYALQRAEESLRTVQYRLDNMVEDFKYAVLSAMVQEN